MDRLFWANYGECRIGLPSVINECLIRASFKKKTLIMKNFKHIDIEDRYRGNSTMNPSHSFSRIVL